jgi:hypothetical protein
MVGEGVLFDDGCSVGAPHYAEEDILTRLTGDAF